MRKLRAAVVGFLVALPAALTLPAAVPVAAGSLPGSCGGVYPNGSAHVTLDQFHGGTTVNLTGSSYAIGEPNFTSGGTVYFSNASGMPDTNSAVTFNGSNNGTTIAVVAPPSAFSGDVMVCINNDSTPPIYAGFYTFNPTVSSVSPGSGAEGTTVTVNGNFLNHGFSTSVGSCGVGYTWVNESQVRIQIPGPADSCSGSVGVSELPNDNTPALNGHGGNFSIIPTTPSVRCASPCYPGSTISVSGSGYGNGSSWHFGPASGTTGDTGFSFSAPDVESGTLSIAAPHGSVSTPATSITPHITNISRVSEGDSATVSGQALGSSGSLTLGGSAVSPTSWSMDQVQFVVPSGAATDLSLTRDDGQTAGGQLSLVPVISSVSPASAAPGSYVYVSGSGFGANQGPGSVSLGGHTLSAQSIGLWSDTAIAFVVPAGASSGRLIVNSAYNQSAAWNQNFTVASATSGGGGTGGSTSGGYSNYGNGNSGTLNVRPNYGFLPLPQGPTPIAFHITAPSTQVRPGSSVDLSTSLQLNGKAIAGATITYEIADSPGTDTILSGPSAVTDAAGVAHITLHTSKKPGQTVVIAHSGAFADQIRILTITPAASLSGVPTTVFKNSTLDPHILIPFVGLIGLAIMLLLGAVLLQLRLNRRQPVPAAAVVVEAVAPAPKPRAPRKPRADKPASPKKRAPRTRAANAKPIANVVPLVAAAEDIADVIPLPTPADPLAGGQITRTRGTAKRAPRTAQSR